MTISTETNKTGLITYTGAATYAGVIDFAYPSAADLKVYVIDDFGSGARTLLDGSTDYTISNTDLIITTAGANTISALPYSNERLTVYRQIDELLQTSDFSNQGAFLPANIEAAFDFVTYGLQQHEEQLQRCIQIGPWDTTLTTAAGGDDEIRTQAAILPTLADGGVIYWDSTSKSFEISADVNVDDLATVSGIAADVTTVATNIADIQLLADDLEGGGNNYIQTVATNIANVNATGGSIANVNAVGTDILLSGSSKVLTVGTDLLLGGSSKVGIVAGIFADVTTVAGISADVTTVAGIDTDVTTVAGISADVTEVAANTTQIQSVIDLINAADITRHDDAAGVRSYFSVANYGAITSTTPVAIIDGGAGGTSELRIYVWSPVATSADDGITSIIPTNSGEYTTIGRFILRNEQYDNLFTIVDSDSTTRKVKFDLSGVTTGNTRTLTVPDFDGTIATLAGTETFTNKTIDSANNTLTLDLSEGTLTGTTAEFNTALSDDSFATLTNSVTLTNKTVNLASNTLTGTLAEFNTALSDENFVSIDGAETLTNKTLTSPVIDLSTVTSAGDLAVANGGTGASTGRAARVNLGSAFLGYTPMDYSATGDGTTDDYTAINNAMSAASSDGVPLVIDRPYASGTQLNVPDNLTVIFQDNGQLNATGSGNYYLLGVSGSGADINSSWTITNAQNYGDNVITLSSVTGIEVDKVYEVRITVASPGAYTLAHISRVVAISGSTVTFETPWPFSFANTDTVAAFVEFTPATGVKIVGGAKFDYGAASGAVRAFESNYTDSCVFGDMVATNFPASALGSQRAYNCDMGRWRTKECGDSGSGAISLSYAGNCRIDGLIAQDCDGFGVTLPYVTNSRFGDLISQYAGVVDSNGRGVKFEGFQLNVVQNVRSAGAYYNGISLQQNTARNTFVNAVATDNGKDAASGGLELNGEHNIENVFLSVTAYGNPTNTDIKIFGSSTDADNAFLNVNEDASVSLGNGVRTRFQRRGARDAVVDEDTGWYLSADGELTLERAGSDVARLDTSGRLIVGGTSNASGAVIEGQGGSTGMVAARANSGGAIAFMQATTGTLATFGSLNNVPVNLSTANTARGYISTAGELGWGGGSGTGSKVIDPDGGLWLQTDTAANIADKTADVNITANKGAGKTVWDTTNTRIMVATGGGTVTIDYTGLAGGTFATSTAITGDTSGASGVVQTDNGTNQMTVLMNVGDVFNQSEGLTQENGGTTITATTTNVENTNTWKSADGGTTVTPI